MNVVIFPFDQVVPGSKTILEKKNYSEICFLDQINAVLMIFVLLDNLKKINSLLFKRKTFRY